MCGEYVVQRSAEHALASVNVVRMVAVATCTQRNVVGTFAAKEVANVVDLCAAIEGLGVSRTEDVRLVQRPRL